MKWLVEVFVCEGIKVGLEVVIVILMLLIGFGDYNFMGFSCMILDYLNVKILVFLEVWMNFIDVCDFLVVYVVVWDNGIVGDWYFVCGDNIWFFEFFISLLEVSVWLMLWMWVFYWLVYLVVIVDEWIVDNIFNKLLIVFFIGVCLVGCYIDYDNIKVFDELGFSYCLVLDLFCD